MYRPLVGWYGGKTKLAKRINACFLNHRTYVSTHAGGLSDLWNKRPAPIEVINDLDPRLTNLYLVATLRTEEFLGILRLQPYTQHTFDQACEWSKREEDPLLRAVGFLIVNRMSFSSSGRTFMIDRMGIDGKGWLPFLDKLPETINRLRGVRLHNDDAISVINQYDRPDTLFYVDPPYLEETRSSDRHYAFEMTPEQHEDLLKVLCKCKGMVYLSGYRSKMYDEYLKDWQRVEWPVKSIMSHSDGLGRDRTECLWACGKAGLYMITNYS